MTPILAPARDLLAPGIVASVATFLILLAAALDAALRGPWLDEFWTLQLSDRNNGLAALIRDGWLRDAHPPLFNAGATVLNALGITSIAGGRLAANLPAAALMILAALRLARRTPGQAGFGIVLLLLVLSLPEAMDTFATYRSYFWQIASVATLALVGRHVVTTATDLDGRRDLDLAAIAVLAAATSIGLHYVGGLFGGLLTVALALAAFARGQRRWALLLGTTAGLAALFIAASVALQVPNWAAEYDHSWIDSPFLEAAAVPLALIAGAILHNPVALLGLRFGARRSVDSRRDTRHDSGRNHPEFLFVGLIAGTIVAGTAIVLGAHVFKPIVVDRYLIAVPVLVCVLMAVPAARLISDRWLFGLMAGAAVAVAVVPLAQSGIKPLWNEGAATIQKIVAGCPSTRVYAASGWVVGPAAETRAAHREDKVFARAYRALADRHGFKVEFLPIDSKTPAKPALCPVLVWYEHTPNEAEKELASAIEETGLSGLEHSRLSAIRSPTGFVLRAE